MTDKPQGVGTTLKDGRWVQVDEYPDGRVEVIVVAPDRAGKYVIDLDNLSFPYDGFTQQVRFEYEVEDEDDTPAEPRTDDGGRTFYKEEW